jgi:hypothetical protein
MGGLFIVHGFRLRSRGREIATWPTTTARIVHSEIALARLQGARNRRTPDYELRVTYEYQVRGRTFTSNVVEHGTVPQGWRPWAETQLEQFPVGASVTARYDPRDPASACLRVRRGAALAVILVGAFFLVAGIAAVLRE